MILADSDIKTITKNVANQTDGLLFIQILLDKLGAFERGFNFNNREVEVANKARREQGLWLLDLLMESNFQKFIELQEIRRNEVCQNKKTRTQVHQD